MLLPAFGTVADTMPETWDAVLAINVKGLANQGRRSLSHRSSCPERRTGSTSSTGDFPEDRQVAETALLFLQLIMRKLGRQQTSVGRPARAIAHPNV
jgi:hypothetical protein